MRKKIEEEYAYVLDILPQGRPEIKVFKPVAQVIGEKYFILLEVIPKDKATVEIGERVYIGKEYRPKIYRIVRRISYNDLTDEAKKELEDIIEKIVESREKDFVEFFNKASAITPRLHALELLPRIGKKILWEILEERKNKPFESFEDIKKRVVGIADPKRLIVERILMELRGEDKYKLFVA